MNRLGVSLAVGLGLASFCEPARAHAQASMMVPTTSRPHPQRSSSWWFKKGESHQWRYEYVEAGAAYVEAFKTLSPSKQRGGRGARVVMLAADAYWLAFEHDADVAHLHQGLEALDQWLAQGGPSNEVKLRANVEPMAEDIRAVLEPLQAADPALEQGDLAQATEHYSRALATLTQQGRAWSCGTLLVMRLAQEHLSVYDQLVAPLETGEDMSRVADIDRFMPRLGTIKDMLLDWQVRRPPSDPSIHAADLERQIAAVGDRIADAKRRMEAAERKRQADEQARIERQQAAAATAEKREQDRDQAQRAEQTRKKRRKASIAMGSAGMVVTAGGATMLGLGLAFNQSVRRSIADERAKAEQTNLGPADRDRFEAELGAYEREERRKNIGMIAGGSALLAGGLVTLIVGITWFSRYRPPRGRGWGDHARLVPSISRSTLGVTLSKGF